MNTLSLFSGAGGMDIGFQSEGLGASAMVEIDKACRSVLAKHYPFARLHDDVRTFTPQPSEFELVHGGFPCTDISAAKDRWGARGVNGAASGLWWEFARIIEAGQPDWVVIENTGRLRNGRNGSDFAAVVGELERLDYMGIGAVLDAAAFGLPARRPRVFIVARSARDARGLGEGERLANAFARHDPGCVVLERPGQPWPTDDGATRPERGSYRKLTPLECERALGWPDDYTRWAKGNRELSATARYKMIGNGVAAPVAAMVARVIKSAQHTRGRVNDA